jgi:hypothetical protein
MINGLMNNLTFKHSDVLFILSGLSFQILDEIVFLGQRLSQSCKFWKFLMAKSLDQEKNWRGLVFINSRIIWYLKRQIALQAGIHILISQYDQDCLRNSPPSSRWASSILFCDVSRDAAALLFSSWMSLHLCWDSEIASSRDWIVLLSAEIWERATVITDNEWTILDPGYHIIF